jgi:hypothetical protein
VRAPGRRGGPGEPSAASEHEPRDEPGPRAVASGARRPAGDFPGSGRKHGSRWIGSVDGWRSMTGPSTP